MSLAITILNAIVLLLLVAGIAWWHSRYGKLTEKNVAFIVIAYGVFFIIAMFTSVFMETGSTVFLVIGLILLLIVCVLGYPYARWMYGKFNSRK